MEETSTDGGKIYLAPRYARCYGIGMKSEEVEECKPQSIHDGMRGKIVDTENFSQRVKDILLAQPLNPLREFSFSVLPRTSYGNP